LGTDAMERMALEVVGEEGALVVAGGGGMARFVGTLCTPMGLWCDVCQNGAF